VTFNDGVEACRRFRERRPVTATPFYLEELEKLKRPEPRPVIPLVRQTRTFVLLEVTSAAYREVETALRAAGYDHAFVETGEGTVIDMHGIALAQLEV
jgi:hypothetical protein